MRKSRWILTAGNAGIAAVVLIIAMVTSGLTSPGVIVVPSDANPTCTVSSATFNGWFQGGTATLNGVVNPANGITFPNTPNCSFYQWSHQMFLWVTSPAPSRYGGGAHIFDSPTFYDVTPLDSSGQRHFVPHVLGRVRAFAVRSSKPDPNGLQPVFSRSGQLLEVVPPQLGKTGKPLILNAAGQQVEVNRVNLTPAGKVQFFSTSNKLIPSAKPLIRVTPQVMKGVKIARPMTTIAQPLKVQRFIISGHPIFVDPFGNPVPVEQGQADGSVLMARNNSLIYYATIVNDVYAYFATGQKDGTISATQFPTTTSGLNAVTSFASAHGKTFPDPNALAVELKTSWVELTGLPNPSSYITTKAIIPTYNTSNPNTWTPTGTKVTTLALVGMHVVGSVNGHPEMIWATFEHKNNSPDAQYTYNSTSGPKTVPQDTSGTWLFCCGNAAGPFDQAHMQQLFPSPNITSVSPFTISPSDTIRWKAWGAASDQSPNPIDGSATASNTEIIAIDHAVQTLLPSADIRNNYIMTGATWTIGGAAPSGSNQVGTSKLMNSTLETYVQGVDTTHVATINCFGCHTSNTTNVSHVYAELQPLF